MIRVVTCKKNYTDGGVGCDSLVKDFDVPRILHRSQAIDEGTHGTRNGVVSVTNCLALGAQLTLVSQAHALICG